MKQVLSKAVWAVGALSSISMDAAAGQSAQTFEGAVEVARLAWLRHDLDGLLEFSDTIRVHLPDGSRSVGIRPHHAARVLKHYLKDAQEVAMALRSVRTVADDHRYVEMVRRFVVPGTADELQETVFFGLRLIEGGWVIREVRIAP